MARGVTAPPGQLMAHDTSIGRLPSKCLPSVIIQRGSFLSTSGLPLCAGVFQQEAEQAAQALLGVGRRVEVDGDRAELGGVAVAIGRPCPAPGVSRNAVLLALDRVSLPESEYRPSVAGLDFHASVGGGRVQRYPLEGISLMQTPVREVVTDG